MRSRDECIKAVKGIIEDFRDEVIRARSRKSKRAKQGALQFYKDILHHLTKDDEKDAPPSQDDLGRILRDAKEGSVLLRSGEYTTARRSIDRVVRKVESMLIEDKQ